MVEEEAGGGKEGRRPGVQGNPVGDLQQAPLPHLPQEGIDHLGHPSRGEFVVLPLTEGGEFQRDRSVFLPSLSEEEDQRGLGDQA
ncbi:MAG: hypothetical protein NQU48_01745 [Hadesarchaea archaeon]|nr:hypothetical protein [Hadesarchaea archaeon]